MVRTRNQRSMSENEDAPNNDDRKTENSKHEDNPSEKSSMEPVNNEGDRDQAVQRAQPKQQKADEPVSVSTSPIDHSKTVGETVKRNSLTKLLPGYRAPMQLGSTSRAQGIEALRRQALVSDSSTARFVYGSKACRKRVAELTRGGPSVSTNFKRGNPPVIRNDAGDGWFGMKPSPMTDELKRDMQLIKNRNYLDPKRFYKSSDTPSAYVQAGTVIEGSTEFYSSRLTKKQRRSNLTEEIMADPQSADYARNKYKSMQREQTAKYMKRRKSSKR